MTETLSAASGSESADAWLHVYVLHSRPWRESSLLLDVFSAERGRLRISARGVKGRKRSPLAGLLQPFVPLRLQCRTANDYLHLQQAELSGVPLNLQDEAGLCGLYANELLMRLLPEQDAHPELFVAYSRVLHALAVTVEESALRAFEWALLGALGYAVDLQADADGEGFRTDAQYRLDPHAGWVFQMAGSGGGSDGLSAGGEALLALAGGDWTRQAALAKRMMRRLLDAHLGDKPLATRELWQTRKLLRDLAGD